MVCAILAVGVGVVTIACGLSHPTPPVFVCVFGLFCWIVSPFAGRFVSPMSRAGVQATRVVDQLDVVSQHFRDVTPDITPALEAPCHALLGAIGKLANAISLTEGRSEISKCVTLVCFGTRTKHPAGALLCECQSDVGVVVVCRVQVAGHSPPVVP